MRCAQPPMIWCQSQCEENCMSKAVLEINDHAMSLYNDDGLVISSPGYVLASGKQPQFGQQAIEQSRLHPVSTNNEFWYRLGMAPLARPLAHFRNYADIANGHLMHLAEQSDFEGDVVIAVPASFNREQLAVLTGVLQHSPFNARAIMDAALVAASHLPENTALVYADLQLHQLSFTKLVSESGKIRRDGFAVVPGAGSIAISNTLVQVVNDAFIAQSRFNPQHSAVWEQQLYNELPTWLQQFDAGQQEILVEIDTANATVQARVGISDVLDALQPTLRKISQHFAQFAAHSSLPVVLSARAALIPGMAFCLKALPLSVGSEQVVGIGLRAAPATTSGSGVSYISSVTSDTVKPRATDTNSQRQPGAASRLLPTHVVHQAQAWPLPVSVRVDADGQWLLTPGMARQPGELFSIEANAGQTLLHSSSEQLRVAGQVVNGSQAVSAGDVINSSATATDIQLIRVHT